MTDTVMDWKTSRKWYVIYQIAPFAITLIDLEKSFQLLNTTQGHSIENNSA